MAGQPSSVPPPFAPAIAPINYPRDPNNLLNFAKGRMDALGSQLSPQELNDYRTLISQLIDTGKVGAGKPLAMASQLRAQATTLLNQAVPGLDDLNKAYAISKAVPGLGEGLIAIGKKLGHTAMTAAAAKLGWNVFNTH
jgi:hypothetical protein